MSLLVPSFANRSDVSKSGFAGGFGAGLCMPGNALADDRELYGESMDCTSAETGNGDRVIVVSVPSFGRVMCPGMA
jgi:hypothetical protein